MQTQEAAEAPPRAGGQDSGTLARRKVRELFGLDVRSLAVFRVGLALVLIADLAIRATDLEAHYTDAGLLPRSAVAPSWVFSPHLLHGSAWFEAVLFLVAGVAAGMLLVGYRTRAATFVSWLLLVSLHARNPVLTQGGDILHR